MANEHPGVNTNVLSPGDFVDVLSGNAAVNGIPVTISPGLTPAGSEAARDLARLAPPGSRAPLSEASPAGPSGFAPLPHRRNR